MSRAKASGRTKNVSINFKPIYSLLTCVPFLLLSEQMPYMNDAITSNISEINGKNQDDRTTTLGVLSILNGGP